MAKQPLPETESITLLTELLEVAMPRGCRPKLPTVDQLLRRVPPSTNTEVYLPLDLLLVTRDDLQQALERHGFTVEKVITRPVSYLKLTRTDGEALNLDSNGYGSNFNDTVWEGKIWEHRILPYDPMFIPGECFHSITWARNPEPGEVPPRLMQAWSLMESSGPTDISPTRKQIQAEEAEKKRVAGLEEENKRLREELALLRVAYTNRGPADTALAPVAAQVAHLSSVEAFFALTQNPERHVFVPWTALGFIGLLDVTGNIWYRLSATFVKEHCREAKTLFMLTTIKGREELAALITKGLALDIV